MTDEDLDQFSFTAREAEDFASSGVSQPVRLFDSRDCVAISRHFMSPDLPAPAVWWKGHAVADSLVFALATRESILARIRQLIGDDIVLWGAQLVKRGPGQPHVWHTDVETIDSPDKCANVWIGIENVGIDSGLRFVTGTQAVTRSAQEAAFVGGWDRAWVSDTRIIDAARSAGAISPRIVEPVVSPGDAVFFSGGIWHCSRNQTSRTRSALLLQYSTPDVLLRVPDHLQLNWPVGFTNTAIPCVLVSGTASHQPQDLREGPSSDRSTAADRK